MKKITLAIILLAGLFMIPSLVMAQSTSDEVTLVVSADGATKEEATKVALRSAIEQAYGTFVSANTTILNDELVKDEIVTVSQGNIKNYKEIACEQITGGKTFVTLQATVCISKLVSYAKSKGASTEFAGAAFGMNMKIKELNKQNEEKALANLYTQVKEMIPYTFTYDLKIEEPMACPQEIKDENNYYKGYNTNDILLRMGISGKSYENYYLCYFTINAIPTEQMRNLVLYINQTCKSLALTSDEVQEYKNKGLETYPIHNYFDGYYYKNENNFINELTVTGNFRSKEIYHYIHLINLYLGLYLYNFEIVDNLGVVSYLSKFDIGIMWGRNVYGVDFFVNEGTNLFEFWSCSGVSMFYPNYLFIVPTWYKERISKTDRPVYAPAHLPYRFSCYKAIPIFNLDPIKLVTIPVIILKSDIDKYSKFDIRPRTVAPTIDKGKATEIEKRYFNGSFGEYRNYKNVYGNEKYMFQ